MVQRFCISRCSRIAMTAGLLAAALALGLSPDAARADEAAARRILKTMADYVASQPSLALSYDAEIEVITPALQKIQFSASGEASLLRPDKARLSRRGGYADLELVFDGKTATVHDRAGKKFTQIEAAGSFDQLVDKLRSALAIDIPGADLLSSKVHDELSEGILDAKYIGHAVVAGVECEHLAFRNHDTDWQIWVELGERPIPRKYVITSKGLAAAPQYTLRIRDWKTGPRPGPEAFSFVRTPDLTEVAAAALTDIDEVPPGIAAGGIK